MKRLKSIERKGRNLPPTKQEQCQTKESVLGSFRSYIQQENFITHRAYTDKSEYLFLRQKGSMKIPFQIKKPTL